jgi:Fe-S-cluster-containing hydrogenase component 2
MSNIRIDLDRCDASPLCPVRRVCPNGAVTPVAGGYAINSDSCTACGVCIQTCPMGAVSGS